MTPPSTTKAVKKRYKVGGWAHGRCAPAVPAPPGQGFAPDTLDAPRSARCIRRPTAGAVIHRGCLRVFPRLAIIRYGHTRPEDTGMKAPHRRRVIKVYVDEAGYQRIAGNAASANLFLSDYLRRIALGHRVRSVVDRQMVGELRRLGAMLKHLYPKASHWTTEEKRRYWAGYEQLMMLAAALEEIIGYPGPG